MSKETDYQYTPSHIANFFLEEENHRISNLVINKLVYISLGFALSKHGRDLFLEEVEAWKYGPVIPSIYHEFKKFGSGTIHCKSNEFVTDTEQNLYPKIAPKDAVIHEALAEVQEYYTGKEGGEFINITHHKNTPWSIFYEQGKNKVIDKNMIKLYYDVFLSE